MPGGGHLGGRSDKFSCSGLDTYAARARLTEARATKAWQPGGRLVFVHRRRPTRRARVARSSPTEVESLNGHRLRMLRRHYAADVRARRPGWPSEGGLDDLLASYEMDFACVPNNHPDRCPRLTEGKHVVTEIPGSQEPTPARPSSAISGRALLG